MRLLVDIGGTHIRLSVDICYVKYIHKSNSLEDLIKLIEVFIQDNKHIYSIDTITVAIPCILNNFVCYNETNLKFLNMIRLPKQILGINVSYHNDGDMSLLGEIKYNNISKDNNILSIIFGTGVGCGLWIYNIVKNSEIHKIFENYLGGTNFENKLLQSKKEKFVKDLSNIIELLNINVLILNGFIINYPIFRIKVDELLISNYHKENLRIIYSECSDSVLLGLSESQNYSF